MRVCGGGGLGERDAVRRGQVHLGDPAEGPTGLERRPSQPSACPASTVMWALPRSLARRGPSSWWVVAGRPAAARSKRTSSTDQFQADRPDTIENARSGLPQVRAHPEPELVTRPCVIRSLANSPAPETIRVPSCRSLRARILPTKSPSSMVFHGSGPRKVRDATSWACCSAGQTG
jgi:hypothetical protein